MKKLFAILTAAAAILTLSSCGSESAETTTTTAPAAATTTTAAPEATDAPETNAPEETEAPDETDAPAPAASDDPLEILKANAPLYAYYYEESMAFPVCMTLSYGADLYGTGSVSQAKMTMYMESLDRIAVETDVDGTAGTIILDGNTYYIVSPDEKAAIYLEIEEAQMDEIRASMTSGAEIQFDPAGATYETGRETFEGAEYYFNKITAPETGELIVYGDSETELRYIVAGGITMKVEELSHKTNASVFEIPSDYTLMSMAEAMGMQ